MQQRDESLAGKACILVLQGGGAMGAYHIGAYQALAEHGFEPDWVCGISIGAINAAIIAGNKPPIRLQKLTDFWERISRPTLLPACGTLALRTWEHVLSYAGALTFGQPGFFTPRPINPYFAAPGVTATSFYDTAPLYATLADMLEIDRIRSAELRLSVGATNVESGELEFFDNRKLRKRFGPEHVVASGSLPPGFPATMIDGKPYWDGGCVSNTPLKAVLDDVPTGHSVVFVVDLWSASGPAPETMAAVEWRAKQIQYASRNAAQVAAAAAQCRLLHAMRRLGQADAGRSGDRLDIVHIIYHPGADQIPASDAEFSRPSIAVRRAAGLADMRRVLDERPWERAEHPTHLGCLVHRVTPDGVHTAGD
jgi:NTE family protein